MSGGRILPFHLNFTQGVSLSVVSPQHPLRNTEQLQYPLDDEFQSLLVIKIRGGCRKIFGQYGKRWGIETGYRVKKETFRARTTSKNYSIRLFYFLFSVLLYNLWILLDLLVCLAVFGRKMSKRIISSKLFSTMFRKAGDGQQVFYCQDLRMC